MTRTGIGLLVLITTCLLGSCCPPAIQEPPETGVETVGWREVRVHREGRGSFRAWLFYPSSEYGRAAPLAPSETPFPGVVFGHGYLANPRLYRSTIEGLAGRGYLVIAPFSGLELFPSHQRYADDLSACLTYLEQENGRAESPLFQRVDTAHFGISGHSMGGGAAIFAAADDSRVKALVVLAPSETRPSAIAAISGVSVPVSLIVGTEDSFTPTPVHAQRMYDNAHAPRQVISIIGGFHCGFIDRPVPVVCDCGSISRADQLEITRRQMAAFFDLYLKNDETAWDQVWGSQIANDPAVVVQADP